MEPVQVEGIEELKELIGRELGPTDWVEVTQEDIDTFADVSRDHQWIHVDRRAGREGEPVRHHGRARQPHPVADRRLPPAADPEPGREAGDQLRLEQGPLPGPGAGRLAVRASAEVLSVEELGDGWWHVVTSFTVEVEGQDKPVCVADSVGRALIG